MTTISLMIYGAIGVGVPGLLFLLHELRNAPYDSPEPAPALSELEKQRLRYTSWD